MAGVGNGAAEEDWRWDLNPGSAAKQGWDCVAVGAPSCHMASETGETLQGRKVVKGLLPVSHEKVPHRFGLRTGDPGNTADGAGACGRPASRARITGRDWESSRAAHFYFFS